jgi:hypothetical protein
MYQYFNTEVNVLSYYFSNRGGVRGFPRRIEWDGRQLEFLESGLRCLVGTGQSLTQIFNMSDGRWNYRLRFDPDQRLWTLLSRKALS